MQAKDFTSTRFGSLQTNPASPWPHAYYLPASVPRELDLDSDTVAAMSRATLALGRLSGLALLIDDPELLLGPAMAQEALSSSRIEGTQASLSDVLSAEGGDDPIADENLREVSNYLSAVTVGRELIQSLPLTQRFFCALHRALLEDVRGEEKSPGELRRSPVWIGSPNARPETAKFIPPHQDHLGDLLSDWERFVNEPSTMPPVLRCALTHYQFETIHPFLDGNGRIGRLLIGFQLMNEGILTAPILHISGYFERNRDAYYNHLQAVRERGEIQQWVQFFVAGVEEQADASADRIRALVRIREQYRKDAMNDRSVLPAVIDLIFRNPVITTVSLMKATGVSQPTARTALLRAQERGWVHPAGTWGQGGKQRWVASEIWKALTGGTSFEEDA